MRPRWKWLLIVAAPLAVLGLVLLGGHERKPDLPPAPESGEVHFPMPAPPPLESPVERARGIYLLETPELRVVLELVGDRTFRFTSAKSDGPAREAHGTWSLAGSRLTLAYTHIAGFPAVTADKPVVAVNTWNGRDVVIDDTGGGGPVTLTKHTAIRAR